MEKNNIKPRCVYLGCGHARMKDFIHIEINLGKNKSGLPDIVADISDYLPFKNDSVNLVFSRATMEHLTYNELLNCFLESHRILKKGGCIRMVVPSFDKMINDYLDKKYIPEQKNIIFPNEKISNEDYIETFIGRVLYFDHRYLHNFYTLKKALEKAGFSKIRECQPGDSKISEAKEELYKAEINRPDDIIVEAVKLDRSPAIKKYVRQYPKNPIAYFLAKYLNIEITSFVKRKAMFPHRYWLKTLIKFNKYKDY